jgi:hypothetical protein
VHIVYLEPSENRSGKLEEIKTAMNELAAFVEANEPQLIAHNLFFSEDCARSLQLQNSLSTDNPHILQGLISTHL